MPDRLFFPLAALAAVAMVALALVWPRGASEPAPAEPPAKVQAS